MTSDLDLMRKATEGDERAFETLVSRYEGKIYHMALRYTGDAEEALDITQEVFLRMYRSMAEFQGNSSVSTWVYRIADNVCKDVMRRVSSRATVLPTATDAEDPYEIEIPDLRYNPESVYDRAALRETIVDAISSLPEHMRKAIILREIAGFSYEEIAECLDLEMGTVKSRIARGRDKLRIFLSRTGNKTEQNPSKDKKGGVRK